MHQKLRGVLHRRRAEVLTGAVMLGFGLWGLDRGSMYSGEAATHWSATLSFHDLFHLLDHVDAVHGLYYVIIHFWFDIFGTGETTMRVPSVLGLTGAVVLVTIIGRRLSGSARLGVVAGLLTAFAPFLDEYAQNGRSYALVCLGVWATCLVLLRTAQKTDGRTWPGWLLYGVLLTVTSYLHEFAILVVLAHGSTLLLARVGRPRFLRWLVTAVASSVLLVPLVVISHRQDAAVSWIAPVRMHDLFVVAHNFFGTSTAVAVVLIALAVIGAAPLMRRTPPGVTLTNFAVPLLVLPPAVLMIESAVAHPLFDPRYVLYSIPAGLLLAAAGVERVARWLAEAVPTLTGRLPALIAGALVVLLVLIAQVPTQLRLRRPDGRPQDYAAAARFIATTSRPGDGVLFISQNFRSLALGYPQSFDNLPDLALSATPKSTGTLRGTNMRMRLIAKSVLAHRRVFVTGLPFGESTNGRDENVARLIRKYFVLVASHHWTGIDVTLWQRGARGGHTRP